MNFLSDKFSVGDRVVLPPYYVGQIVEIGPYNYGEEDYFHIAIEDSGRSMKIYVPVDKSSKHNMRKAIAEDRYPEILELIHNSTMELSRNHVSRRTQLARILNQCNPFEIASMIGALYRKLMNKFTPTDYECMREGIRILKIEAPPLSESLDPLLLSWKKRTPCSPTTS